MAINKELLLQVKEQILADPGHFSMGVWAEEGEDCGTVCCIAGRAVLLSGITPDALPSTYDTVAWHSLGALLLGLHSVAADTLFYVEEWPEEFAEEYEAMPDSFAKAEVAAEYIDYFIATGA